DLPALDHVLDLVAAAERLALGAQLVHFLRACAIAAALTPSATAAAAGSGLAFLVDDDLGTLVVRFIVAVFDLAVLDGGHLVAFAGVDFFDVRSVVVVIVIRLARLEVLFVFVGAQ